MALAADPTEGVTTAGGSSRTGGWVYGLLLNFSLRLLHRGSSYRIGLCCQCHREKVIQRFSAAARFSQPPQGLMPMA